MADAIKKRIERFIVKKIKYYMCWQAQRLVKTISMLASQHLVKLERILNGKNEISSGSETAGRFANLLRLRFG